MFTVDKLMPLKYMPKKIIIKYMQIVPLLAASFATDPVVSCSLLLLAL